MLTAWELGEFDRIDAEFTVGVGSGWVKVRLVRAVIIEGRWLGSLGVDEVASGVHDLICKLEILGRSVGELSVNGVPP